MKQAAILGERQAGLVDVPDLEPKEDWAVVKVHAAPMCTEYHAFVDGRKSNGLGHEAAGEVVAVAQPGKVEVGRSGGCAAAVPVWKMQFVRIGRLYPLRGWL